MQFSSRPASMMRELDDSLQLRVLFGNSIYRTIEEHKTRSSILAVFRTLIR